MTIWRLDNDHLDDAAPHWDAAVDRTPDVDPFCASSIWSFSAASSFPDAEPPVVVTDGAAFCGMRARDTEEGRILVGMDPVWGFATPFVGPPRRAAEMLACRLDLEDDWSFAVVAGQREDSALTAALAQVANGRWRLYRGPEEQRLRADLSGGVDAWFSRRSSRFRQRIRRLERDAETTGIEIVDVSATAPDEVFDRLLAIEQTGWKGGDDTGLASDDLADFYRRMCVRLAAREHLRVLVARHDGTDIGFVLGGVRGDTYRGLQLSYHREHGDAGVGHLLQMAQIRLLVDESVAVYDMGMEMPYKTRWADRVDATFAVIVSR
ncbi:GNAT family N-acetyltransferase [Actinospongicola halichondriae]|uniref:GNAT family N-acetyltransferase n=1 Tax=Actinospongicola halichondriae TaxID=3236844 RepID=UPI003D3EB1BC